MNEIVKYFYYRYWQDKCLPQAMAFLQWLEDNNIRYFRSLSFNDILDDDEYIVEIHFTDQDYAIFKLKFNNLILYDNEIKYYE